MKIIVGLGNPGMKYEHTRHNAGWLALDALLKPWNIEQETWRQKFHSKILFSRDSDYILAKPQTFMNESGKAVKAICQFYKSNILQNLLIIHDDSDLPLGALRATASASSAGHNGVRDIIEKLGTQDFHRIRIGVESRQSRAGTPTEAFILQNFTADELATLRLDVFPKIQSEIENFLI